jgi:tetratricopeptide (TPR) repeat protein
MSYLLETLGRGLLTRVADAFKQHLPDVKCDTLESIKEQLKYSSTSTDLMLRMGTCALRNMRLAEARQAFQAAAVNCPDQRLPQIGLACIEDELGNTPLVLGHLNNALEIDPTDPAILFALGMVHERAGEMQAATRAYQHAIAVNPHLQNAYERLAAMAIHEGQLERAAEYYEELINLGGEDFDALLMHAVMLRAAKQPFDAENEFQRALLIEPEPEATLGQAEEMAAAGAIGAAIQTVGKLVQECPGVADYHVQLGDLYVKAGSREEAIEQYRLALEFHPNMLEATIKLGTQQLRAQDYQQASQHFSQALSLNDRLIVAFVGLGLSQCDQGRRGEAAAMFQLAASLDANSTLLFAETARIGELEIESRQNPEPWSEPQPVESSNQEMILESLRRHEQAVRVHPNQATLCYHYGLLLRFLGRDWEAQQAFAQTVTIDEHFTQAHIRIGVGHLAVGDEPAARRAFERAFELDADAVRVRYELALLFTQRSVFDQALDQQQAMNTTPGGDCEAVQANLMLALQQVGLLDRVAFTLQSLQTLRTQRIDVSSKREAFLSRCNGES